MRKLSGLTKYGNITLKCGHHRRRERARPLQVARATSPPARSSDKRKKVVIVVQDEAGAGRGALRRVSEAWPIKYDPSDLNGKGNEVLIELLELVNEGIERVK